MYVFCRAYQFAYFTMITKHLTITQLPFTRHTFQRKLNTRIFIILIVVYRTPNKWHFVAITSNCDWRTKYTFGFQDQCCLFVDIGTRKILRWVLIKCINCANVATALMVWNVQHTQSYPFVSFYIRFCPCSHLAMFTL